jgi:predicted transcriptional regulator of viral defense system
MNFRGLLEAVGDEAFFETGLLLAGDVHPADVRRQLGRWTASRKILQLRRGLYALAPPFQRVQAHPFLIANHLVVPSYVSMESALAYFGMIPEYVPRTTSVTTGRPGSRETALGSYAHRHIAPRLFFGAEQLEVAPRQQAFVATPEKALLDLVHLTDGGGSAAHLRSLRLQSLERLDLSRLVAFAERTESPKLLRAARAIRELVEEEGSA